MALTKTDFRQIGEIVADAINGAVSGLATKDELDSVKHEIRRVRLMLEKDNSRVNL